MTFQGFFNRPSGKATYPIDDKFSVMPRKKHRIWEDMNHGFIYDSREFVDWLKALFLPAEPDIEFLLQHKIIIFLYP